MNWHEYFFEMCDVIAKKSKDPDSKFGCVIVGKDHEIRSTGYNSFPRGINDNVPARSKRPEKYFWMAHGERNAIYNAARVGIPLDGCTIYTQVMPCNECAIAIIQCGIKTIIYDRQRFLLYQSKKYSTRKFNKVMKMLEEAGVNLTYVNP
jgi:dCMP deaminase